MISTIPLGSNLGYTVHLNRMINIKVHEESWNDLLMLVNWMFLFLYVGWTTLGLIPLTPHFMSRTCAIIYLSCVRYGRMGKSWRSRTPLIISIKNIWIIQWVFQTMIPFGPSATPYIPICVRGWISSSCNFCGRHPHARFECSSHKIEAASGSTISSEYSSQKFHSDGRRYWTLAQMIATPPT